MRKYIYLLFDETKEATFHKSYSIFMMSCIGMSFYPLLKREVSTVAIWIEQLTAIVFIADYILRWIVADMKLQKGFRSFLYYPFTFLAITDLLSILPNILLLNNSLKLLKIIRLGRLLRVFRMVRYSKNISMLRSVLQKQRDSLLMVGALSAGYIFLSALLLFTIEPQTFPQFFDALYWATISLTTVGYGDIFAVSTLGKVMTMISSLLGVAIVALPAGIITAGYLEEMRILKEEKAEKSS